MNQIVPIEPACYSIVVMLTLMDYNVDNLAMVSVLLFIQYPYDIY